MLGAGNSIKTAENVKVIGLVAGFKINLGMILPANNIIQKMLSAAVMVEKILKAILKIIVGEDEKDLITFAGSEPLVDGDKLIYEISFDINYRVNNL